MHVNVRRLSREVRGRSSYANMSTGSLGLDDEASSYNPSETTSGREDLSFPSDEETDIQQPDSPGLVIIATYSTICIEINFNMSRLADIH